MSGAYNQPAGITRERTGNTQVYKVQEAEPKTQEGCIHTDGISPTFYSHHIYKTGISFCVSSK